MVRLSHPTPCASTSSVWATSRRVGQANGTANGGYNSNLGSMDERIRHKTDAGPPASALHLTDGASSRLSMGCALSRLDRGSWWAGARRAVGIRYAGWSVFRSARDVLDGPLVPPYASASTSSVGHSRRVGWDKRMAPPTVETIRTWERWTSAFGAKTERRPTSIRAPFDRRRILTPVHGMPAFSTGSRILVGRRSPRGGHSICWLERFSIRSRRT